jgi:hypothetical protein
MLNMDTKFYVELPVDKYGNTAHRKAVVEAYFEDGRLIPVAPHYHATGWPNGLSDFGGWKEVEGPARMLEQEEWKRLTKG